MAFLSGLGRTSCSPGVFRMTCAVLFIMVTFVCVAQTLEDETLENLRKEFEALYLEVKYQKELNEYVMDVHAESVKESNRIIQSILDIIQYKYAKSQARRVVANVANSELKSELLERADDLAYQWKFIQKIIAALSLGNETEVIKEEL